MWLMNFPSYIRYEARNETKLIHDVYQMCYFLPLTAGIVSHWSDKSYVYDALLTNPLEQILQFLLQNPTIFELDNEYHWSMLVN